MARIIRNDDKINSGIQESRNAINGLNSVNQKLSNISEFPRIGGSKISAAIGECTSKISEISSSLGSVESSIQGALMELNSVDYESMNQILNSMANKKNNFSSLDYLEVAEAVLEGYGKKSYISKDDLKTVLIGYGLSEKKANKIAENYDDLGLWNELLISSHNKNTTAAIFVANTFNCITGEGDIKDAAKSGVKYVGKEISTQTVAKLAGYKGVLNICEGIADALISVTGAFGTKNYKNRVMDAVSVDVVGDAYDLFYNYSLPGKIIDDLSAVRQDGKISSIITNVTETGTKIGISLIPGAGPAVSAAISGGQAVGEKAEKEYSKEDRSYWGGLAKSVTTGGWEAAQWYLGAKIGGTLNATNASQVSGKFASKLYNATSKLSKGGKMAVSAGSEAIVGGADTIVRTSIDNIDDNRSWWTIFNEDYGGISGVITNAATAASIDIGFDIGGNLFGKVKTNFSNNVFGDSVNKKNSNFSSNNFSTSTGTQSSNSFYSLIGLSDKKLTKEVGIKISNRGARHALADDIRFNLNSYSIEDIKTVYSNIDSNLLGQHYNAKSRLSIIENEQIFEDVISLNNDVVPKYTKVGGVVEKLNRFIQKNQLPGIFATPNDNLILTKNAYQNLGYIKANPDAGAFYSPIANLNVFPDSLSTSDIAHENVHYTAKGPGIVTGFKTEEKYRGINEGATEWISNGIEPDPDVAYRSIFNVYKTMESLTTTAKYFGINHPYYDADYIKKLYYQHDVPGLKDVFTTMGGTEKMWDDFVSNSQIVATTDDLNVKKVFNDELNNLSTQLHINGNNKLGSLINR